MSCGGGAHAEGVSGLHPCQDHHPDRKLQYLQKLVEEVGELAAAMRRDVLYAQTHEIKGTVDEELYDVLYYVVALANACGVDLEEAMSLKEPVNAAKYGRGADLGGTSGASG